MCTDNQETVSFYSYMLRSFKKGYNLLIIFKEGRGTVDLDLHEHVILHVPVDKTLKNREPTANHCYIFICKIYGTICSFNKKKKS